MLRRIWNFIKANPGGAALALAVMLGLVNGVIVATALSNRAAARELSTEVEDLTESLAQLRQIEQEGLRGLEEQALSAEAELAMLKQSFPVFGEPFDIYRQGFALAGANQVEIHVMETGSSSLEETPVGVLEITTYRVDGVGEAPHCIGLLDALEQTGLAALALNGIRIDVGDHNCDFEVVLASLGEIVGEVDPDG